MYLGDFQPSAVIDAKFTTVNTSGVPTTLAGTPAVLVYKDNSTTESASTGITLTVDFDSRTGLHHVRIDTSQQSSFFTPQSDYQIVITAGTVGGTSVVGYVVGKFSIRNRPFAGVVFGSAATGTLTTTSFTTNLTEATDNHYNGRRVVFLSGPLAGQATFISDYVGSTKRIDCVALTEAPANGDLFMIV